MQPDMQALYRAKAPHALVGPPTQSSGPVQAQRLYSARGGDTSCRRTDISVLG